VISPRGIWPLYPTCDVVVPHTRNVRDMLIILDALAAKDRTTEGDFWREQRFIEIPEVQRPSRYLDLLEGAENSLREKKIAVPRMYVGGHDPKAKPTAVVPAIIELWKQARQDLESLGATVIETDFPLVTNYEDDSISGHANNVVGFKQDWNGKERGELVAYLWDDFIKSNGDPNFPGLAAVDGSQLFPDRPPGYLPDKYLETKNFMNYPRLVELAGSRNGKSIWDIDGIAEALPALEAQRKRDLEDWMDSNAIDLVVFPANGDTGKADLESDEESARVALQNGVKYSNGNRAIRHMGVPTVSVTMGLQKHSQMPVNLTLAGKHGQDSNLLRYAYAYEQRSKKRQAPPLTPALPSDTINLMESVVPSTAATSKIVLSDISASAVNNTRLRVTGTVETDQPVIIEAFVGRTDHGLADQAAAVAGVRGQWEVEVPFEPLDLPKPICGGYGDGVRHVVVILKASAGGHSAGKLLLVDQHTPAAY
jgi:Asp-tRNA(Asn)/Glu-tRNA(Gln) amidotransferase A subunit family amidase